MTMPDCRNDDFYNEDFVAGDDAQFLKGFDWAVEMAVDNFFDNLGTEFDDSSYLRSALSREVPESMQEVYEMERNCVGEPAEKRAIRSYEDLLRYRLLQWVEMERDQLIVSMIDNMDEDIYNSIRRRVLKKNAQQPEEKQKQYYDSRRYAVTGKKEFREE